VASQPTAAEVEATKAALKAEADAAKAHHAELNRIDNPLGAQVMDAVRQVDQGLLTRTLIAVQRGEDMSKHLKTAADQMGISPDLALGYLTIVSTELDKQVQRFAQRQGVSDYPRIPGVRREAARRPLHGNAREGARCGRRVG
jgi:hypothetical protein